MTKVKFKGIDDNTVIHCPLKEDVGILMKIFHDGGYVWDSGRSFFEYNPWDCNKENTCYNINIGKFCDRAYYEEHGKKILSAEDFISQNLENWTIELTGENKEEINTIFQRNFIDGRGYIINYGDMLSWSEIKSHRHIEINLEQYERFFRKQDKMENTEESIKSFSVEGPKSLIQALKEEADSLNWILQEDSYGDKKLIHFNISVEGSALKPGYYWYPNKEGDIKFNLPQDWDKCLELLKLVKETYKRGEWLYYKYKTAEGIFRFESKTVNAYWTNEHIRSANGIVSHELSNNSQNFAFSESNSIRKATNEEIVNLFTQLAIKKGFTDQKKYIPVRPTVTGDKWGNNMVEAEDYTGPGVKTAGSYFSYNETTDTLFNWGRGLGILYEKGVWAQVSKPKELRFGNRKVIINGDNILFDHFEGTIDQVKAVYNWHYPQLDIAGYLLKIFNDNKSTVTIGCTTGTLGELKDIIDEYDKIHLSI